MATLNFSDRSPDRGNMNEDQIIDDFGELIRRSETADTNQNLRSVITKLETNMKDNERYVIKMFLVDKATGSMLNADNSPNVSFRVDTINLIFDSICDSVRDLDATDEQIDAIFYKAGEKCGREFGKTFSNYIDLYKGMLSAEDKIAEWCNFDSSVGWGKLAYDKAEDVITITNNFQAKPNDRTDEYPQNCSFFRGYVAGVLSKLLKKKDCAAECACAANCPKVAEERTCVIKFR